MGIFTPIVPLEFDASFSYIQRLMHLCEKLNEQGVSINTIQDFLNNLDRYVGINKSKIRVKNIKTNKIQMINKEDFDPLIHTTDYDKSLFGHKNKITKESKIITLFDNENNIIISDYWINYETRLRELNLNIDVNYLKNRLSHHRNVFSINGYENWRIQ